MKHTPPLLSILFLLLLCALCAPAARAQSGTTTVSVWVQFEDGRGQVGPRRAPRRKVVIRFVNDIAGEEKPEYRNGSFVLQDKFAGEWGYQVTSPDGSLILNRDPDNPAVIHVVNEDYNRKEDITLTIPAAYQQKVRHGREPQLVLTLYRPGEMRAAGRQDAAPAPPRPGRPAPAQSSLTVEGHVVDEAQAPVAAALVSVLALRQSGQSERMGQTVTNAGGHYSLSVPAAGKDDSYFLAVTKAGYRSLFISVDAGQPPPRLMLRKRAALPVASAQTAGRAEVEVSVAPPFEGTRRYIFLTRLMQSLPVSGFRSFDGFALLAPGVLPPPQTFGTAGPGVSPYVGTSGQFAVNGLRSRENNFTVDGSDNNDEDIGTRRQGFVALAPQSVETLQEFQVITLLGDARYGRNIGGQVNALTQSGTSGLHASLFGFFTHDRLNARDFFDYGARGGPAVYGLKRESDGAPVLLDGQPLALPNPVGGENSLRRAQGGFLVSGRLAPTDTFFFAAAERKVSHETHELHFAVPTVRQRGVFDSGDTGLKIAGAPAFPSTVVGNALFSLYPLPNNPIGPYGANTYTAVLPADANSTLFTIKLNQRFGNFRPEKGRPWWLYLPLPTRGDILTGRYNFTQDKSLLPVTGGALSSALSPRVRTQNIAFFLNRRFSPRTFDTLRASFGRTRLQLLKSALTPPAIASSVLPDTQLLLNAPLLLNVTAPNPDGTLGQPRLVSASSAQGAALLSALGYAGVTETEQITGPLGQVLIPGFSPVGVDVFNFPQTRANNTIQFGDTVRHVRGAHTFTFGADVRKVQINSTLERSFRPLAQFNGLMSSGAALGLTRGDDSSPTLSRLSGATLAAAGVPTGLFQTLAVVPDSTIGIRYTQVNLFVQDEWNMRPNLRLTFGFRYEINTIPDTAGKRLERAFDPDELRQKARAVAAACGERCNDLVAGLTNAFPANFRLSFGSDRNDFDGRIGFAYDPGTPGKAVIRGGIGTYSGLFPGFVISQSRNAFPDFVPLNLANFSPRAGNRTFLFNPANPLVRQLNPALDIITPGTLNQLRGTDPISLLAGQLFNLQSLSLSPTTLGLDLVLPQGQLKTPYAYHYGIIVERLFFNEYYISASYVGTRGVKLLRVSTPERGTNNAAVELAGVETLGAAAPFPFFTGSEVPPQTSVISDSFAVARTLFESSAASAYNSLQFELRKRYVKSFQITSALTYSHSIDDASDYFDTSGAYALPQNSLRRSERGSSGFDARWRWVTHFLYDFPYLLPFYHPGLARALHGWRAAGIVTVQTGQPYTVNSAFDVNRDGNLTDRLNGLDGLTTETAEGDASVRLRLSPAVAPESLLAKPGLDGAVGRNTFRAPGVFTFDGSLTKIFILPNRNALHFRTEVFNVFNRTHFAIPERIFEAPTFGKSVRTSVPARTVQFSLKYFF